MDEKTLLQIAGECQHIARKYGDRQNSPSQISAREATDIVNAMLNAGNVLETVAKQGFTPKPKENP